MLNLKKYREALGISQAELARRLGMSRGRYNNYEHGLRTADYETLLKLSEELGCTVEDLIRPDDPEHRVKPVSSRGETENAPAVTGESVYARAVKNARERVLAGCTPPVSAEGEKLTRVIDLLRQMNDQEIDVVLHYLEVVKSREG